MTHIIPGDGLISKMIKYGAIFFAGYYLGGGCTPLKDEISYKDGKQIEKRMSDLEKKVDRLYGK